MIITVTYFQILLYIYYSEAAINYLSWICYRELLATQHTVFSLTVVATCTCENEPIYAYTRDVLACAKRHITSSVRHGENTILASLRSNHSLHMHARPCHVMVRTPIIIINSEKLSAVYSSHSLFYVMHHTPAYIQVCSS